MSDSRGEERGARPWRRWLLALALGPLGIALLTAESPAASPSPSPTATPTPTPTQSLLGTLTIEKIDLSGNPLADAHFRLHLNTPDGNPVGAELVTNAKGTASRDLVPGKYCAVEVTPPPGFLNSPTFLPDPMGCAQVTTGGTVTVTAADPPSASPTPTATPTPTPSPTAAVTGELEVSKVDTSNTQITAPGFTFNIHVGSANGQVVATIATDSSGKAIAGALNPATYCVEETAAPDGYQVAPTYSPSNCVTVAPDTTNGRAPTLVTVADPPAATPSAAAGVPSGTASPSPTAAGAAPAQAQPPASPVGAIARGLIGIGGLLLIVGAVMIVIAIRRRRRRDRFPPGPPSEDLPPNYWYDSTIG